MKNILVTGCNGQLGNEIQQLQSKYEYNFIFTDIHNLDITKEEEVETFFKKNPIDVVINCAAYTAVDRAEDYQKEATLLNKVAPSLLAAIASKYKAFLIHLSTDYVYDGSNFKPYLETDTTQPTSVYAHSKLDGEIEILFNTKKAIIIRTSWLYSSFGNNFVKTIMKNGKEKDELKVVFDQIGTPTYARDLAKAILDIIPQTESIKQTEIYHYSNEGACSWYDFAKEIIELGNITCKIIPVESKDYPTPVRRPHYSVLNKRKIKNQFKIEIPYWKDSLKECIELINKS